MFLDVDHSLFLNSMLGLNWSEGNVIAANLYFAGLVFWWKLDLRIDCSQCLLDDFSTYPNCRFIFTNYTACICKRSYCLLGLKFYTNFLQNTHCVLMNFQNVFVLYGFNNRETVSWLVPRHLRYNPTAFIGWPPRRFFFTLVIFRSFPFMNAIGPLIWKILECLGGFFQNSLIEANA